MQNDLNCVEYDVKPYSITGCDVHTSGGGGRGGSGRGRRTGGRGLAAGELVLRHSGRAELLP